MVRYSPFVDGLLRSEDQLLEKLNPTEPVDPEAVIQIREANEDTLTGGAIIRDIRLISHLRAALFYLYDALPQSHRITAQGNDDIAAYMHGMLHRREGDFENARYWFGRAGQLPIFAGLHGAAAGVSGEMSRQTTWDPGLLSHLFEQEKFGDNERHTELVQLQRVEFRGLFDYLWRLTVDSGADR